MHTFLLLLLLLLLLEYNKKLASITKRLRKKNSGYFYLFDAWESFTTILDNPEDYRITHATGYCADWYEKKMK